MTCVGVVAVFKWKVNTPVPVLSTIRRVNCIADSNGNF